MKHGFALIEIVLGLIVLGVLIGGFIVGQKLFDSAKVRNISSDYTTYNTAVNTFKLKYNCLPGDCAAAAAFGIGTSGDGDNTIDIDDTALGGNKPLETFYFWQQLGLAQLMADEYTGTADKDCAGGYCYVPRINVPQGESGIESIVTYLHMGSATKTFSNIIGRHVMVLGSIEGPQAGRYQNAILTPYIQSMLDDKYDNGLPYSGSVVDVKGVDATPDCTTSENVKEAVYNLDEGDESCTVFWAAPF